MAAQAPVAGSWTSAPILSSRQRKTRISAVILALVVRGALLEGLGVGLRFALRRIGDHWARPLLWVGAVFVSVLLIPIPYNVAFKLVTVSGLVTLPLAGYALARAARLPFPGPPIIAISPKFITPMRVAMPSGKAWWALFSTNARKVCGNCWRVPTGPPRKA